MFSSIRFLRVSLLCAVVAILIGGRGLAQETQETKPAPAAQQADKDRDKRLTEIERILTELMREVRGMKTSPATPAAPATPPAAATPLAAADSSAGMMLPEAWLKSLTWRAIGPANMGGRIVDLAVYEKDPSTFWVATASGGLLKTINNGVTFEHQFDKQATVSLGAVAVAPSDDKIVWAGTGEDNPRNSVSYGDGVYKSTDGGKKWTNMGLRRSYQIGHIAIHPKDPNIVYVGALGRLYGPSEERGLFKTTDGGESWQKVLYIDEHTGIIDFQLSPADPETLIVAAWERSRDGFDSWPGNDVPKADGYDGYDPIKKWGKGSGLYKTTDGGKSWKKLQAGLPTSNLGRIGIDWYRKDPKVLFAIIDCETIAKGPKPIEVYLGAVGQDVDGTARLTQVIPDSPADKAGMKVGDVIAAVGDKEITGFDEVLEQMRGKRAGQKLTFKLSRGEEAKEFEIALANRPGQRGGQGGGGGPGGASGFLAAFGGAPGLRFGAGTETRDGKVVVTRLVPNRAAAKAGIAEGDTILSVDDKPFDEQAKFIEYVGTKQAGDKLKVKIKRGDEIKELELTLEEAPNFGNFGGGQQQQPPASVYMGIQGEDVTGGTKLTVISANGPAEKAGLEVGDIVQSIDGKNVAGYEEFVADLRTRKVGDTLQLTVLRGEEKKEIAVTLEDRPGGATATRPYSFNYGGQNPNAQDQQGAGGFNFGGVYKSTDGGETWTRVNSLNPRPMYFSVIRVDPSDDQKLYVLGIQQYRSSNGGQTFEGDFGNSVHADGHAMWIDPRDGRHMLIGVDGGTYATYDRGANWDHLNQTAIGQFYHVAISQKAPYYVTGGLQDNGTWMGPSVSKTAGGPINEDWISVAGGDGFMCRVDPDNPDLVYYTSQDGNMGRRDLKTGERASFRPERVRGVSHRFNWNTPFILSSLNSRIFYCAGNYVFRSLDRGSKLQAISPEITLTKRGSATALAESPRDANVLYVGTDDGALWVTRDGGREWTEIGKNVGLPGPRWVATIEPSRYEDGRVYVAFDGHRSDDDEPYVYASEDFGKTWKSLRGNLPYGSTRCLREDSESRNLLFLGTEFGAWFSLDKGQSWNKFNTNLPTVAVHELAIHPNNGELVAATHGRSLWITDISVLRQIKAENLQDKIALYEPEAVIRWLREPARGGTNRRFTGSNPASGAHLFYSLPAKAQQVSLKINDIKGETVWQFNGSRDPGLHRVTWNLTRLTQPQRTQESTTRGPGGSGFTGRRSTRESTPGGEQPMPPTPPATNPPATNPPATAEAQPPAEATRPPMGQPGTQRTGTGQGRPTGGGGGTGQGGGGLRAATPGTYRVVLTVDGQDFTQTVQIERDPNAPATLTGALEEELYLYDDEAALKVDLRRRGKIVDD